MSKSSHLSIDQLKKALEIAEKIEALENQLSSILGTVPVKRSSAPAAIVLSSPAPSKKGTRKKRTMSPEGRERIAAAQRKRWAEAGKQKKDSK